MLWLFSSLALAAPSWIGDDADVSATRTIAASPEAIYNHLLDVNNYATLLPAKCVDSWTPGVALDGGEGAGVMVFDLGWVNPNVEPSYINLSPHRNIDIDHLGPRGFISRFLIEGSTDGSTVEFRTFVEPPGIPFRKAYWTRVRPRWTECHVEALDALAARF